MPRSPFSFPKETYTGTDYRKDLKKAQTKFRKSPEGVAYEAELTAWYLTSRQEVQATITPEQRADAQKQDDKEQRRYNFARRNGIIYYGI